jgi:DNA repair protein RadC
MANRKQEKQEPDYLEHRRRLKARFDRQGFQGWPAYEVLELLLTYVIPRVDVKPRAKELLKRFKTVKGVLNAPAEGLEEVAGIGPETSRFLRMCRELLVFYLEEPEARPLVVDSPARIEELCRSRLEGRTEEHFLVLFLDNRHRLIASEIVHQGTVDMSIVYPREIMTRALRHRAAALLVAHNHPGGSTSPSADDVKITRELEKAAATLGIRLLDHLIVAGSRVVSLRELGEF